MTNLPMYFFPDEPIISDDLLGFDEFIALVSDAIKRTHPPFVYGVLGDWGVGKTSMLQMLRERYETELRKIYHDKSSQGNMDKICYVPVWFNAWKYENETNIMYPLLHAIENNYKQRLRKQSTAGTDFGRQLKRVATITSLALSDVLLRIASRPLLGDEQALTADDLRKWLDDILKDEEANAAQDVLSSWTNLIDELENAFTQLLQQYSEDLAEDLAADPDKIRFIVFIDDLDRCLPDTTIKLLESIKNYFAVNSPAIFILGLNPNVVYQGMRHKFGGIEIDGREYLEKILNYTFYVPQPSSDKIRNFAFASLNRLTNEISEWQQHSQYFHTFGQVLSTSHFTNPRKVKRILNRFLLFISKYESALSPRAEFNIGNVIRLLLIAEYYPTVFQLMLNGTYDPSDAQSTETFGSPNFSIEAFESRYGITVRGIYPQLAQHNNLFTGLRKRKTDNELNLAEHVDAVYTISRII